MIGAKDGPDHPQGSLRWPPYFQLGICFQRQRRPNPLCRRQAFTVRHEDFELTQVSNHLDNCVSDRDAARIRKLFKRAPAGHNSRFTASSINLVIMALIALTALSPGLTPYPKPAFRKCSLLFETRQLPLPLGRAPPASNFSPR